MSNIATFIFESHTIRTKTDASGDPWFVGSDVCKALTIGNSRDAVGRLDDDEKGVGIIDTLGGKQEVSITKAIG